MYPGSPVNQTKWLVFRMIYVIEFLATTNGLSLVGLDFPGVDQGHPLVSNSLCEESMKIGRFGLLFKRNVNLGQSLVAGDQLKLLEEANLV